MPSHTAGVAEATWQDLDDTLTTLGHRAAAKAVRRVEMIYPALQAVLVMGVIVGGIAATYVALSAPGLHPVLIAMPLLAAFIMLTGLLVLGFGAIERAGGRRIVAYLDTDAKAELWRLQKALKQLGGPGALPVSAVVAAPGDARTAGLLKQLGETWLSRQDMTGDQLATAQQLAEEFFTGTYDQLVRVAKSLA